MPRENVPDFLESSYVAILASAMQKIQKKLKQSQVTKKRKADEDAQKAQADPTAAASSSAQSSCTAALVPLPKTPPKRALATSSGQPDAPRRGGDQSWSWNRDRYTVATCVNRFNQA